MIYLFTSEDVEEVSKLFNIHCTYWSMLLKSLNFAFKVKEIIALKDSIKEIMEMGEFDENSKDFVKNVRMGDTSFKMFLGSAWLK